MGHLPSIKREGGGCAQYYQPCRLTATSQSTGAALTYHNPDANAEGDFDVDIDVDVCNGDVDGDPVGDAAICDDEDEESSVVYDDADPLHC
jgi:hypothetical protein